MKHFISFSIFFVSPIFLCLIILEIVVGNIPNSYSYKYSYIVKNGKQIEALAIGHSQLYDGFKPESFFMSSFNLCNSAQNYIDDFYLIRELLPYMPNLKVAILPIGYLNVGVSSNDGTDMKLSERSCYYHKYMNLNYDGKIPIKYLYECFDPSKALEKVNLYYIKHSDIIGCDSMGRRSTHYLKDRKHELGFENIIEGYTRKESNFQKLCLSEEYYLMKILEMLIARNISIVMVSPPIYWNCGFRNVNKEQKRFIKEYMETLCKKFPILFFDYESNTTFVYDDFYNETHLSEIGAEKFTKLLNKELEMLKQ